MAERFTMSWRVEIGGKRFSGMQKVGHSSCVFLGRACGMVAFVSHALKEIAVCQIFTLTPNCSDP